MSDFQREHRYWVIKRKHLTPKQDEACRQFCGRMRYEGVPEIEAAVVESDWPIYEMVWHLVERLTTGQRLPYMTDEHPDKIRAERDALAAHVERLTGPAVDLANTVENRDDIPITKWALKCARLVPQVQQAGKDAPETSLARQKAEWQAEALELAAERLTLAVEADTVRAHLRNQARKLRRQAEDA